MGLSQNPERKPAEISHVGEMFSLRWVTGVIIGGMPIVGSLGHTVLLSWQAVAMTSGIKDDGMRGARI
jgi:hypothetical protein